MMAIVAGVSLGRFKVTTVITLTLVAYHHAYQAAPYNETVLK